ncbi:hypothetical protein [Pyxidicoccus trucidator]|uniref:hypothetical protein n=1 Tax=Pyxidicoccus trucidator TaxID=2709662 RepID=UPI0013DB666F|nr:hypothetical protein [Pyxidicoccus trucidator]
MSISSLKSLLSGAVLLASSAAFAGSATTIPAFDAKIATARGSSSPGGTTINRAEMQGAVDVFLQDDGQVDSAERAHLTPKLSNTTFLTGITGSARKLLSDFHELNDAATVAAPLGNFPVAQTPAVLFGATGSLAANTEIREGYIPNGQGVANQATLVETFNANAMYGKTVDHFTPITTQELIKVLGTQYLHTKATPDEVDGAVTYIQQISRNSDRLYFASWAYSYHSGYTTGFVVAAVSSDRRFVRFVDVLTYGE